MRLTFLVPQPSPRGSRRDLKEQDTEKKLPFGIIPVVKRESPLRLARLPEIPDEVAVCADNAGNLRCNAGKVLPSVEDQQGSLGVAPRCITQ
jgi:hypothetical protein